MSVCQLPRCEGNTGSTPPYCNPPFGQWTHADALAGIRELLFKEDICRVNVGESGDHGCALPKVADFFRKLNEKLLESII